jgi:hypothetical protein
LYPSFSAILDLQALTLQPFIANIQLNLLTEKGSSMYANQTHPVLVMRELEEE